MIYPIFIDIDGKCVAWRKPVQRCREQPKAAATAVQPALFELMDGTRPAWERDWALTYARRSNRNWS